MSPPEPEPAQPEPEAGSEPPKPPRARRRRVILGGCALAVIAIAAVTITIVLRRGGDHVASGSAGGSGSGKGALHAPAGPQLPDGPDTGVHLTGFVVDGAGLPVAGAEVTAELERGMPDKVPGAAQPGDAGAPPVATAVAAPPTGPDGHFTVTHLVAGRYRVRVTGPGLLAAEVRFVPVPSDAARLVVARQVSIEGTVADGGKPVANAHVGLRGDPIGGGIETLTDAAGRYRFDQLPEGRYQLYAWQGALAARTLRIARLGAGPFGPVELALEAGAIVVGRVIDRDEGVGLPAAVELRPVGDDQAPRYARTADDGTFKVEGVPAGSWIADAFAPGYASPGGVELVAGKVIPELALVRGAAIEGRVVDGDGAPIAGATIRALTAGASPQELGEAVDRDRLRRYSGRTVAPAPAGPTFAGDPQLVPRGELGVMVGPIPPLPPPGSEVARTASVVEGAAVTGLAGEPDPLPTSAVWTTGADGKFRVIGAPRGKLTVVASAPGFADGQSKPIAIAEPAQVETGVEIVLTAGTFVVGTVADQRATPIPGAQVAIGELVAYTDGDGAYRLGPLTGKVDVRATAYGHGDAVKTVELAPVTGKTAAELRVDLVLPVADSELSGLVEDATGATVPSAEIELVGTTGGDARHAIAQPDGTFRIDLLPAGPVRLRIKHPAYPVLELAATASDGKAQLRIRLPLGGAVEGAVIDDASGGPLANATVAGSGPDRASAEATTDARGRFVLGPLLPGAWKLAVRQPGFLPAVKELDVPVSRAPGATSVHDVLLAVARGAVLGGTVRDARGARIAGARVTAGNCEGESDAQGEFRLRDCATGEIDVAAQKGELRGSAHRVVHPGDEAYGLAIELR